MNKKVVVIGGGVIGCLSAIRLKEAGFSVTIIDKSEVGKESSWAGAGILFPLLPWDYDEKVYDLCSNTNILYQTLTKYLLEETGINTEFKKSGMLITGEVNKKKLISWANVNQFKFERKKVNDKEYLYFPEVSQIRPPNLMKALKKLIIKMEIEVIENVEMKPFIMKKKRIINWPNIQEIDITADYFVVTAGAWSGELLKEYKNKIYPIRGQMIQYKKNNLKLEHIYFSDNFYLLQRNDGVILAGSTSEDVGFNTDVGEKSKKELKNKAEKLFSELKNIEIENHWSGFRPGSDKNIPFIKRDDFYENLYINSGHFRYGLSMAPKAAEMLTELLIKEVC
jgi:glycine oxidase